MYKLTCVAALVAAVTSASVFASTSLSVDAQNVVSPTGAILAESLNNKDQQYTEAVYEVVPGVWSVTGLGMDNINVIEGETGLIVIDGGITRAYARKAMSMLPEEVASKPVKGFIYSHWHYILGAGEWNVSDDAVVVAHENHQSELTASTDVSSPTAPARMVRGQIQLGTFLPKEGQDSPSVTGLVNVDLSDITGYVAPTKLVGDEETEFEIDGVKFVTHAGHSDTLDGLSIYMPEQKVSIDNTYCTWLVQLLYPTWRPLARNWLDDAGNPVAAGSRYRAQFESTR